MNKFALLTTLLLVSFSCVAHHGTQGQFDASQTIEISGLVTDVAYVNPHAYVYVDVKDSDGNTTNWNCELRSASVLNRSGWKKDMFRTGTQVEIVGVAARKDPTGCYVETIAFNGGAPIARYDQIEENQLQPESARPRLTPWGVPYLGGDWAAKQNLIGAISGPNAMGGGPMGGRGATMRLSKAGQAAKDAHYDASDRVTGRLDCKPRDFFRDWTFDQIPNGIYQEEDKIVLKYGFMSTERTIHLNMDDHPDNIRPSWAGHSIGRWENDVLIVETTGFTPTISARLTRSDQYRTIERFTLDYENGSLNRSYEAEDPQYWLGTQTGEDVVFLSDYHYEPYNCDDRSVE